MENNSIVVRICAIVYASTQFNHRKFCFYVCTTRNTRINVHLLFITFRVVSSVRAQVNVIRSFTGSSACEANDCRCDIILLKSDNDYRVIYTIENCCFCTRSHI